MILLFYWQLSNYEGEKANHVSADKSIGALWQIPSQARFQALDSKAVDLVCEPESVSASSQQLVQQLNEPPLRQSDYFVAIQTLCSDLVKKGKGSEIANLLKKFSFYEEFTAPKVRDIHSSCGLVLLISFASKAAADAAAAVAAAAAAAASAKPKAAAKGGKNAPKVDEVVGPVEIVPQEVPKRFFNISKSEEDIQLRALGAILLTFALQAFPGAENINYFPSASKGPYELLDPKVDFVDKAEASTEDNNLAGEEKKQAEMSYPLTSDDYIRYISAAIQLFCSSNDIFSATYSGVKFFNYITNDWLEPSLFAKRFQRLQSVTFSMLVSLVDVFESNVETKLSSAGNGIINSLLTFIIIT